MKVWGDDGEAQDTAPFYDFLKAVLLTGAALIVAFIFLLGMMIGYALAQEGGHHMHGDVRADADWFDEACCDGKDCKRIGAEEVRREGDLFIWTSKRSGKVHVFHKDARMNWKIGQPGQDLGPKIRNSRDGDFYGCEYPQHNAKREIIDYQGRCLYLPILM